MSEAVGWAVVASGASIYVRTVSETRRAAIINWLVTEKHQPISMYHTDDAIEAMWKHYGQYVDCRKVRISDMHCGHPVGVQSTRGERTPMDPGAASQPADSSGVKTGGGE